MKVSAKMSVSTADATYTQEHVSVRVHTTVPSALVRDQMRLGGRLRVAVGLGLGLGLLGSRLRIVVERCPGDSYDLLSDAVVECSGHGNCREEVD